MIEMSDFKQHNQKIGGGGGLRIDLEDDAEEDYKNETQEDDHYDNGKHKKKKPLYNVFNETRHKTDSDPSVNLHEGLSPE